MTLDRGSTLSLVAALRSARAGLLRHGAAERAGLLGRAGERFLDPSDPVRREAEDRLPEAAGLSAEMARLVIEGMARDWTGPRLLALLNAELPDPDALDRFVGERGRRVRAFAPEVILHVGAGTVPGVAVTSMLRSLLIGSAALIKPGRGDLVLPVLFARALAEEAPDLARAAAVLYWSGGEGGEAEEVALASADLIVVYGGDDTVRALRERAPATTPVIAYHHRMSLAVIGRELGGESLATAAAAAGRAIATFDQRGCVSPHAVLVEEGGEVSAAEFGRALAEALSALHRALPPGPSDPAVASAVNQLRRTVELRAAAGDPVRVHAGPGADSWTVVVESSAAPAPSCLGRTITVHAIGDLTEIGAALAPLAPHLQTVGAAGLGERLETVAAGLGAAGAVRVCRLEDVPFPPPWWHHDGKGPLGVLLRWVDLEDEAPAR